MKSSTALLSTAALVGLTTTLPSVQARQSLDVSHQPLSGFFTADGVASHPSFLANRWQTSELPLDFRKRGLSGEGSKRSPKAVKKDGLLDLLNSNQQATNLVKTIDALGKEVVSFIKGGKIFDHSFGVVISRATNNEADNEWLVNVGYGTRAQTLKTVFDTGSSDTWVYSPACCYADNHAFFDPTKSSTYHNRTISNGTPQAAPSGTPGQPWSYSYGGGSVSGYVGIDTFTIGQQNLRVDQLPVALATSVSGSRESRAMEALLGLATGAGSTTQGGWTTAFEAMSSRGLIDQTYLTATLIKANRNTGKGGGGTYTFGEIDDSRLRGDITWTPALSPYLWGGYFNLMSMGNTVLAAPPPTADRPIRFIIDTGSAVLYLPPPITQQINSLIYGSYVTSSSNVAFPYLVPCDTGLKQFEKTANNPTWTINLGGTNFTIPKEDYVFYANQPVPAADAGGKENMCYSAFQNGPAAVSILGLSFIKNQVIVLDQGGKNLTTTARRIGIGKRTDVNY